MLPRSPLPDFEAGQAQWTISRSCCWARLRSICSEATIRDSSVRICCSAAAQLGLDGKKFRMARSEAHRKAVRGELEVGVLRAQVRSIEPDAICFRQRTVHHRLNIEIACRLSRGRPSSDRGPSGLRQLLVEPRYLVIG